MKPEKNKKNPGGDKRGADGKKGATSKKDEAQSTFTCGISKKKIPKDEEKLEETTKEFYLAQIGALEYQLTRYQRLCDQLQIKFQDVQTHHDHQDQEKSDIISHLNLTLSKKSEDLTSTAKQLEDLQLTSHNERQDFEERTLQLNQTLQDTKDQMNNEIDALKLMLNATKQYQLEKEEVESKMETMMEEMEKSRVAQRMQLYSFERQRVVDINRLRNDANIRVSHLASAFGADVNRRISNTTHAAIQENVDTGHLLKVHSKKTGLLMKENDELKKEVVLLKRKLETMKMLENDIVQRNCSLKQVLRLMRDRCVAMETAAKEAVNLRMDYESAMRRVEELSLELKTIKDSEQALTNENTRLTSELTLANRQTLKINRVNIQLRRLLSEAALAVRKALETASSEDCAQSAYEITVKRNAVIHQLSVLFGSAAVLGVDNDLVEEVEQMEDEDEEDEAAEDVVARYPKCDVPAEVAFQRVINSQRPSRVLPARWRQQSLSPQYRPGDIGAIPPRRSLQQPRIRSAGEKTSQPHTTRFSLVNRVTAALLDQ